MVAAEPFMLVFRFLHIVAGAFWFGAATMFAAFLGPAAGDVGPAAQPIFSNLVNKRKLAKVISGAGATTVLAGLVMYIRDATQGSFGEWISSSFGIVLTIGAIAAIGAFLEGYLEIARNVERLVHLGDAIAARGGPPTPEEGSRMGHLQATIKRASQIDLVLLVIAVSAMATARYW